MHEGHRSHFRRFGLFSSQNIIIIKLKIIYNEVDLIWVPINFSILTRLSVYHCCCSERASGGGTKFCQAHYIVVLRNSVSIAAHYHNAMRGWVNHQYLEFHHVFVIFLWFTWYKEIFIRLCFTDFK